MNATAQSKISRAADFTCKRRGAGVAMIIVAGIFGSSPLNAQHGGGHAGGHAAGHSGGIGHAGAGGHVTHSALPGGANHAGVSHVGSIHPSGGSHVVAPFHGGGVSHTGVTSHRVPNYPVVVSHAPVHHARLHFYGGVSVGSFGLGFQRATYPYFSYPYSYFPAYDLYYYDFYPYRGVPSRYPVYPAPVPVSATATYSDETNSNSGDATSAILGSPSERAPVIGNRDFVLPRLLLPSSEAPEVLPERASDETAPVERAPHAPEWSERRQP